MYQPPEPVLLKYKHFQLYTQTAVQFSTVLYIWRNLHEKKLKFQLSTLTSHMLHHCTISNQIMIIICIGAMDANIT